MTGVTGDAAVDDLVARERERRSTSIQLIASETEPTPAVRAAMGSVFDAKYAEGYPGGRYHGGCEVVDEVESLAIERARTLFGAEYANVQPASGSAASLAVYAAFAQPGDPVLALRLDQGGHLTHGSRANFSGRWFTPLHYGVRKSDECIDYDEVRDLALVHRPRILVAGAASYSRLIDFAILRQIADEAECVLWVDAAHLAGLVAAGVAPSPVPFADVVTVSTNKVIRGPRGGLVVAPERHRNVLDKAVYPFVQGGPAMNSIAAKAVAFAESATDEFAAYARTAVANATALADALVGRGLRIVSGGTDTHLAVVDVSARGLTGVEAQRRLAAAGIVVDKAVLPFDTQPVALGSAFRIGTACATSAGLGAADMSMLATWIDEALSVAADDPAQARIRDRISELPAG
ncbi:MULTISPECIES: serine hydroxymethyltransferase [unclassified Gordonia (in: high G+C Gram-positive bacteria)]|uniref:serine hydroxymethyltransferase n=1 Tax=unclassified Gordonia (in: high G+C Gram-positive bacteria) TaxID=2657482 RepID=UPI001F0D74F5|nr:serine hydroxymethyltransferase [Gordonia sp. ABSL49_1]MCH5644344.1 serine hydroxymethyltransferase [Gordonia sp. ABSL49_1]